MLRHPVVLAVLADHLSVADLFRLHRAVGRDPPWLPETAALVAARMGLKRRHYTMQQLQSRMHRGRRCAECGVPTQRLVRACDACMLEGPLAMWTRADVRDHHRQHPMRHLRRRVREELRVVKRGPGGRHYFWKSDVMALFARHT